MRPASLSERRWWDTAGLDIPITEDMLLTHSSQWQRSQKMRSLVPSDSLSSRDDTMSNPSFSERRRLYSSKFLTSPWSCGSVSLPIRSHLCGAHAFVLYIMFIIRLNNCLII